jgi:TetR/AcrR family transcriptional regulator, transcriptional repressor for nem operon
MIVLLLIENSRSHVKRQMMVKEISAETRTHVLNSAMHLFWARGAERTSYTEIVAATSLSRKALYQLWPDKDALLLESLQAYRDTILSHVLEPLEGTGADGLRQFWDRLEGASQVKGWNGCLLFRSGSGPLASDPQIAGMLDQHLARLNGGLAKSIRQFHGPSNTSAAIDAEDAARASAAVLALISTLGVVGGYTAQVKALYGTGRALCGLDRQSGPTAAR